jgi:hypothetical protein
VTVNRLDNQRLELAELCQFTKLIAVVQKHLNKLSPIVGVANLLGPEAKKHFEAREIALAHLETIASNMLKEMEEARKRREAEFHEREKGLEEKYKQKEQELQATFAKQKDELDFRRQQLEVRRRELDDRAAKHARREHHKDSKDKFKSWSPTFEETPGTKQLRWNVFLFIVISLLLLGGLAGYFFFWY